MRRRLSMLIGGLASLEQNILSTSDIFFQSFVYEGWHAEILYLKVSIWNSKCIMVIQIRLRLPLRIEPILIFKC